MAWNKTLSLGISSGAMALALLAPSTAFAQDTGASTQPPTAAGTEEGDPVDDEAEGDVIIVEGFRAALESATAEKRFSDQIVESVTAEDIGKLPDSSIGESIARLPGITSQRLNGRANVIAIRGFGPDFSTTLLNGREQTNTSDNRAVEFDQYPSEVVNQVVIYKTPTAALVGQGLVGTVDIRTIRPLDYGQSVLAIGARGSYADLGALNAGSNEFGYRVNGTFVDQFADDTIGVSLAASYVDEPYQLQEFNAWGYNNVNGNALIGGSKSFVTSTQLKRLGVMGTVQVEASDALMLTFDGFYSNFDDDQSKRGIELPLGFFAFGTGFDPATATASNGQYIDGTFTNVRGVIRNDVFQREADQYSAGFNARWDSGDALTGFIDVGYSKTDRNELSIESYSGTGYNSSGPSVDIGFRSTETGTVFSPNFDYSDPSQIVLTDPLGWGGSRVQAGYWNNRIIEDELIQARAELGYEFSDSFFSGARVGASYTTREKGLTPDEFFVSIASGANEATIPQDAILGSTDLTYLGLGPILSYDPRTLLANGTYDLDPNDVTDVFAKGYTVNEDLLTMYAQLDIDQVYDNAVLTGNVGLQVVNTDQSSTGFIFTPNGPQAIELGDTYWDFLPSFNLSARFNSDFVVRMSASRQIMRPRLDDMKVSIGYGVDTSVPGGIIRGGGGNPTLQPYRASAIDMTFEKYFGGSQGVVALQLFYKNFEDYIDRGRIDFDFANFPLAPGVTVPTTIGTLDAPTSNADGLLYGAELALTLPFNILTPALDGLGFTGGASITETDLKNEAGNEIVIPGYSKWVVNGTLFYEQGGFNARASARYRSTFLGDFTGFGGTPTRRTALEETIIDAQIGYDFQDNSALDGLSLYFQGQNLTDERFASVVNEDTPLQVIDYQIYGRRFLAGFTYKFQ